MDAKRAVELDTPIPVRSDVFSGDGFSGDPIDHAAFELLRHGERRNHMADARRSRRLVAVAHVEMRKRPWVREETELVLRKFAADARRSLELARPERPQPAPQVRARAPRRRAGRTTGVRRARAPAEPSPSGGDSPPPHSGTWQYVELAAERMVEHVRRREARRRNAMAA